MLVMIQAPILQDRIVEASGFCMYCKGVKMRLANILAFIIRIGYWGILNYNYDKEPLGNYLGPYTKPP